MYVVKIFLNLIIFFFYTFFIKCDQDGIKIIDNNINNNFSSQWQSGIKEDNYIILVEMNKIKDDIDDYHSTFQSKEQDFTYKEIKYKLIITVSEGHKLDYKIMQHNAIENNYKDITEDDKKKFYRIIKYNNEITKEPIYETYTKSLFNSKNWVLVKVKTKQNKEFYAFINEISPKHYIRDFWGPFAYGSNFYELDIIYSDIEDVAWLTNTVASTDYKRINIKGLNFTKNGNYDINNWFINATSLKKLEDIPNFNKPVNIQKMLDGCSNLEDISLGNNKIKDAESCFLNCNKLKKVNLENVSLTKDANLENMFNECKNLEEIKGINTLVKENDNPNLKGMFTNCDIKGDLDLSEWGTKIQYITNLFNNSNLKNLTLFNLKEILKNWRETLEKSKKEIEKIKEEVIKKLNDDFFKTNVVDENIKKNVIEYINLEFSPILTEEQNDRLYKLEENEEVIECYKKIEEIEFYEKIFDKIQALKNLIKNLECHPNILNGSTVYVLNIKEGFMPDNKEDLDIILGKNCNAKKVCVLCEDGTTKIYASVQDLKDGNEMKEDPSNNQNNITTPDIEDPKDLKDKSKCLTCCSKCCGSFFKCCCCCCHKNNNEKTGRHN